MYTITLNFESGDTHTFRTAFDDYNVAQEAYESSTVKVGMWIREYNSTVQSVNLLKDGDIYDTYEM